MPNKSTHKKIAELVIRQAYPEVDSALDWPAKYMGKGHRKLFHSVPEGFVIGLLATGKLEGGTAGVVHVLSDKICCLRGYGLNKKR